MRKTRIEVTDEAENEAAYAVHRLVQSEPAEEPAPPAVYFANLIVKTNTRIDNVTSGKALSISWLARVAVPGVVAILFFFIGLHYYGPESMKRHSMAEAVSALRAGDLDSMLVESSTGGVGMVADIANDVFDVSSEQLAEFYLSSGAPTDVLESLSDTQVKEVASILESRSTNL